MDFDKLPKPPKRRRPWKAVQHDERIWTANGKRGWSDELQTAAEAAEVHTKAVLYERRKA